MRSAAGTPSASAALPMSQWRACAAAICRGLALSWMVSLAMVGPWSGATALSPSTIATRSNATSSSSATICAKRRADASAEIDMAVEGGDFAGGADQDEGFEILGRRRIERRIRRRGPDHRERPERLEIVGASQTLRLKRHHALSERRREPHRRDDLDMRPAPAQVEPQRLADLRLRRLRIDVDQGAGGHDHAVEAIAALRRRASDEGLLHRIKPAVRGEPFESRHRPAGHIAQRQDAGARQPPVDEHAARPAFAEAAAVFRPVEGAVVAQKGKQRRRARQERFDGRPVHRQDKGSLMRVNATQRRRYAGDPAFRWRRMMRGAAGLCQ